MGRREAFRPEPRRRLKQLTQTVFAFACHSQPGPCKPQWPAQITTPPLNCSQELALARAMREGAWVHLRGFFARRRCSKAEGFHWRDPIPETWAARLGQFPVRTLTAI